MAREARFHPCPDFPPEPLPAAASERALLWLQQYKERTVCKVTAGVGLQTGKASLLLLQRMSLGSI